MGYSWRLGGSNKVELGFASEPTQAQLDLMMAQLQIMRNVAPAAPRCQTSPRCVGSSTYSTAVYEFSYPSTPQNKKGDRLYRSPGAQRDSFPLTKEAHYSRNAPFGALLLGVPGNQGIRSTTRFTSENGSLTGSVAYTWRHRKR